MDPPTKEGPETSVKVYKKMAPPPVLLLTLGIFRQKTGGKIVFWGFPVLWLRTSISHASVYFSPLTLRNIIEIEWRAKNRGKKTMFLGSIVAGCFVSILSHVFSTFVFFFANLSFISAFLLWVFCLSSFWWLCFIVYFHLCLSCF